MELRFDHEIYLLFLLLIPLLAMLHLYSLRYVRQKAMRFANFEALEKIVQTDQKLFPNNYLLLFMRILVLAFFTLAAAGATITYHTPASAYDYVVALDVSNSMLAQDIPPDRLSASKKALEGWLSALPQGSYVGLLTFSSQANLLVEPNPNLLLTKMKLSSVVADRSGGTALCEAIKASTNWLENNENPKAIILISDGQNNAGCLLEEGIDYAKKRDVKIFTIGVGSKEGGSILGLPDTLFSLDDTDLKKIAAETGGDYYHASSDAVLAEIFIKLSKPGMRKENIQLAIPLMVISFLLVFIDWGLSITKYRAIP